MAVNRDLPGGWRGDVRKQLEDGALTGAIMADDPYHLAAFDFEGDVAYGPEVLDSASSSQGATDKSGSRMCRVGLVRDAVHLGNTLKLQVDVLHLSRLNDVSN